MPVPEAAINKYDSSVFWQDYIGDTREISAMDPESVSKVVEQRPNPQLWPSVFTPNSRHVPAALSWIKPVSHESEHP